mmetsp:Transcript_24586/g.56778  ORF Transcript_24586/g.56778 Transcript_24586/m.56778 type:complete len:303 (-) Transcript_24586:4-912(-)
MHGDVIDDEIVIRNAVGLESDLGLVIEGQRHGYRFETEIEGLRLWQGRSAVVGVDQREREDARRILAQLLRDGARGLVAREARIHADAVVKLAEGFHAERLVDTIVHSREERVLRRYEHYLDVVVAIRVQVDRLTGHSQDHWVCVVVRRENNRRRLYSRQRPVGGRSHEVHGRGGLDVHRDFNRSGGAVGRSERPRAGGEVHEDARIYVPLSFILIVSERERLAGQRDVQVHVRWNKAVVRVGGVHELQDGVVLVHTVVDAVVLAHHTNSLRHVPVVTLERNVSGSRRVAIERTRHAMAVVR